MAEIFNKEPTFHRSQLPDIAPENLQAKCFSNYKFLTMKKNLSCMIAAIFICGTSVFTSCTVDNADNPVKPIDNLSEKIIGKWITADKNGTPISTNMKQVLNFVSASEAYCSTSMENTSNFSAIWKHHSSFNVSISGNVVTLTENSTGEGVKVKDELDIVSISATELTAKSKIVLSEDGKESFNANKIVRMVKLTADYSETILGIWECDGLTGGETYNDANARLEFLADGTYRYYRKNDAGEWETVTTRDYQKYFVDGTLLATCWKNNGEDELREWWEIASINGDQMQWTALRHKADGTSFQQDMKWKKIK